MNLDQIFDAYWRPGFGSISVDESQFVGAAIKERRPRLFVEIGTATGLSTGVIAGFLEEAGGERLVSIDFNEKFFGDTSKDVGYLAAEIYSGKRIKVEIATKRTSLDLDHILDGHRECVDMCFIDANHQHPWPTLDTIAVLPFMRPGGLMFHHDVALFREQDEVRGIGPKYLFDQLPAQARSLSPSGKSNIFHLAVPDNYRLLESYLADSLLLPWTPGLVIPPQHINRLMSFMKTHWGGHLAAAFNTSIRRFGGTNAPASTPAANPAEQRTRASGADDWNTTRFSPKYRDLLAYNLPRMTFQELSPLRDLLRGRKNLTIVDVGANHGLWSRAFLDCYGDQVERLFMAEPLDGNNAVIDERMRDGFFVHFPQRIVRLKVAVGGRDGTGEIHFETKASALASLCLTESVFGQNRVPLNQSQAVTIQSLETLMGTNDISIIDVLKIDTEGFELDILRGAAPLLKSRKVGIICFEFGINQVRMRQNFDDFWQLFSECGYRLMKFNPNIPNGKAAIEKYSTAHEDFTKNFMLCAVAPPSASA